MSSAAVFFVTGLHVFAHAQEGLLQSVAGKPSPQLALAVDVVSPPSQTSSTAGFGFLPFRTLQTAGDVYAVAIDDVTGDGRADVVAVQTWTPDVSHVLLFAQTPEGNLSAPSAYPFAEEPGSIVTLATVDLDGQHGSDVVVGTPGGVRRFLSTASGTLQIQVPTYSSAAYDLIAVDLMGSGIKDIVALHAVGVGHVRRNDFNGSLPLFSTWGVPEAIMWKIASGDLDNDGDMDVATISNVVNGQPNVNLFRNVGNRLLARLMDFEALCENFWQPRGIGIGDVNDDGFADIVVSAGGNRPNSCLLVFPGSASGSFQSHIRYPTYDVPENIRVVDVDLDGRDDVVVQHRGFSRLGLYLQNADGTLAPERLFNVWSSSSSSPSGLAVGDFTGDGCTDVAIADYNNGLVTLQGDRCVPIMGDGFE